MDLSKFTKDGKFLMLALDHRGSFKKLMNPQDSESVTDEDIISLKNEIIEALKDQFSALLIDETWGLEACHEVCQIKPFLLPLEKTGYTDESGERITELEYSVQQLKDMGANGAKLLLYFSPDTKSVSKQLEIARDVMKDCRQARLPFFLEVVTYQLIYDRNIVDANLVINSVRKFIDNGIVPDVWKLEYPGSLEACQELSNLVGNTPWILLTGGKSFEEFKPELENAIRGGASGFLAGRALWQEVCTLSGEEKQKFLRETLSSRFAQISEITIKY